MNVIFIKDFKGFLIDYSIVFWVFKNESYIKCLVCIGVKKYKILIFVYFFNMERVFFFKVFFKGL